MKHDVLILTFAYVIDSNFAVISHWKLSAPYFSLCVRLIELLNELNVAFCEIFEHKLMELLAKWATLKHIVAMTF